MKKRWWVAILLMVLLVGGCTLPVTAPEPTQPPAATSALEATHVAPPPAIPETESIPTLTVGAPTVAAVVEAATVAIPMPSNMKVQATIAPYADPGRISTEDLPLGKPGQYVNLAFGYWVQYPPDWHTGFGRRPRLVSFSNLDPGTHNRESQRDGGCLVEIDASVQLPGFNLEEIRSQMPRVFAGAEAFELDGAPAVRIRRSDKERSRESDWVYVEHDDLWFLISAEYTQAATEVCAEGWDRLLETWKWIEADYAPYINAEYGYSFSVPRTWYRMRVSEASLWVSDSDPTLAADVSDIVREGMLIRTDVHQNEANLPLRAWIAEQDLDIDLADDIVLDQLLGVRVIREGPMEGAQEMLGYFQGPMGRIYEISCLYPESQQWEFRPIANAVIHSFSF